MKISLKSLIILSGVAMSFLVGQTKSTVATSNLFFSPSNQSNGSLRISGTVEDKAKAVIDAKIKAAVDSLDPDKKLEGDVATMLTSNGYRILKFGEIYYKKQPANEPEGEIDIETIKVIIEVTSLKSGKKDQISKYIASDILNPLKKKIILYAPNYLDTATKDITALGVPVIKKPSDLFAKMTEIGAK
jgi:hypothetical protein